MQGEIPATQQQQLTNAGYDQQPGGYGQPTNTGYDQPAPPPYPGHPPQMHVNSLQSPGLVQPQNITVITNSVVESRPENYLWASILSCLCCNCILGIIAIMFSSMSSSEADVGNIDKARSHGKTALGFSIAAVIVGISSVIILSILLSQNKDACDVYLDTGCY